MVECKFCNLNKDQIVNTVLDETDNFIVIPALGDFVGGYVLIVSKRHLYNMNELSDLEKEEYWTLIQKYRDIFFNIYGKYPIVFEHGSTKDNESLSSVVHAHTHVVNYNFHDECDFIDQLNLKCIDSLYDVSYDKSYIFYLSGDNLMYVSYDYPVISQLVRVLIARDMGIDEQYNWKLHEYQENILNTIDLVKQYLAR